MSSRVAWGVGALAVVVVLIIGITQLNLSGSSDPEPNRFDLAAAQAKLAGAPAPLAALHAQANQLLDGGTPAIQARIAALKGHPIVVNKWASWCGPCRAEFPVLQQAGVRFGKRVALIGLNSGDSDDNAKRFLGDFPLPYPSYVDRNARAATKIGAGGGYPTTVYYNAEGQTYVHQGPYTSQARLDADIRRYALGQPG
jgi:cytochrome c biogenesis protein CcmG/thiol:disulfide interchange protein DsbE